MGRPVDPFGIPFGGTLSGRRTEESVATNPFRTCLQMQVGMPCGMCNQGTSTVDPHCPGKTRKEIEKFCAPLMTLIEGKPVELLDACLQTMSNVDITSGEPAMEAIVVIPKDSQGMASRPESMNKLQRFDDAVTAVDDIPHEDHSRPLMVARTRNVRLQKTTMAQTFQQFHQFFITSVYITDHVELAKVIVDVYARVQ